MCLPPFLPPLQGFLIVTPLRQQGGPRCVMVNRGWVPTEWKEDAAMRAEGQPAGKASAVWVVPLGVCQRLHRCLLPAVCCCGMPPAQHAGSCNSTLTCPPPCPLTPCVAAAARQVRIEGILRHGEDPGGFVPPNEPEKGACTGLVWGSKGVRGCGEHQGPARRLADSPVFTAAHGSPAMHMNACLTCLVASLVCRQLVLHEPQ